MHRRALLAAVLALAGSLSLNAADIEGLVRAGLRSGTILSATVQLRRQSFIIDEHLVGANGRFEFRNVSPGAYVIRVHADGFHDQEMTVNLLRGNSREIVQMELQALPARADNGRGVVSVYDFQLPDSAKREYEKGLSEQSKGGCAKAVVHFEKAIALFDRYADSYNEMGKCHVQASDFSRAEGAFRKAMEYGNSIYPWINLAGLHSQRKRPEEAEMLLRQAILKFPGEGDLYFVLASNLLDRGKEQDAEQAALEAHSRFHRSAEVHVLLAKIYAKSNLYPSLANQLKLYLEENPKGPLAERFRANLAQLEGR